MLSLEEEYGREIGKIEGSRGTVETRDSKDKELETPIYDWNTSWLKGDEYFNILTHAEQYMLAWNLKKYPPKTHPQSTYYAPESGLIYFVEGLSVGSAFGFPRLKEKKFYKWKKMNFTTDLPKQKPLVTYIVASAMKSAKTFPQSVNQGPCFRMHAVMLSDFEQQQKLNKGKGLILCHIRSTSEPVSEPVPRAKRSLEYDVKNENIDGSEINNMSPVSDSVNREMTKTTFYSPIQRPIKVLINNLGTPSPPALDSCPSKLLVDSTELYAKLLEFLEEDNKYRYCKLPVEEHTNLEAQKHFP